jgi:tRNA 2-selenouridine synthase
VVEELLVNYYDPMYDYQIKKKISRVVFKGNSAEVLAYLSQSSKD